MDNVLYRTNIRLYKYKSMIIHTFHPRSLLHSASLHFTTLHSQFFTSLHFWMFRHHASKTLHFSSLIITLLNPFLKICDLQRKAARASARGQSHISIVLCTINIAALLLLLLLLLQTGIKEQKYRVFHNAVRDYKHL
jgi:hypothetical protein